MRFSQRWSLALLPYLLWNNNMVQAQDDPLDQEEPTAPPTSQFQGPESGYIVPIPEGNGPQVNQDRVVDFGYCYISLAANDIDGNQRLSRAEFENFAQDFGGKTECLGPLEELPIELLTVWNELSCACVARGGSADCCLGDNGNIPVTGVDSGDPFVVEEQQYLRQVCLRTDQAIITHCAPPPPPIIPPPPPAFRTQAAAAPPPRTELIVGLIFLFLFLLLPWRRRWIFFAGGKDDDSSESSEPSEDESEDAGGARHLVTETGGDEPDTPVPAAAAPDLEEGDRAEPDDDAMQLRAVGEEEDGQFGGTSFGRTVQEPEYEEEGDPKKFTYEQYDTPAQPEDPMNLKPIPVPVKMEEDEPYDLEHYVPDGGIVQYEREGEWRYDADGGWTPQEREGKAPVEWDHKPYERAEQEEVDPNDLRRQRVLHGYGAGEVFDRLEQDQTETSGGPAIDMFDWVIQSTLNTLDQRGDDLQGSIHSSDESSKGSSKASSKA